MLKRFVFVAGLVLAVGGAAMAQETPGMSAGLAFTYKGVDQVKPVWGIQGRVAKMVSENLDVALLGDLYFQPKGAQFYGGSVGPAVHYYLADVSGFVPYVGVGGNFYFRDKFGGGATAEVNAGAKYAASEVLGVFGEAAWEGVKSKAFNKTPFNVRLGLTYGF